jgi:hypothetical protein
MLRWVAIACVLCSACKVVHSSAGDDDDGSDAIVLGFTSDTTRINELVGIVPVTINLNVPVDSQITVTYRYIDGSAVAGSDFSTPSNTLVFEPGEISKYIAVPIVDDGIDEGEEAFEIELVNAPGASLARTRHFVIITANSTPAVSFENPATTSLENANSWIGVVLTEPTGQVVTVNYTVSGTATSADYQSLSGSISFPPGSIRELIPIVHINDAIDEPDETMILSISQVVGGELGSNLIHTHTIKDDDAAPAVRFTQAVQLVNEGAAATFISATVQLSSASTNSISVPFAIQPTGTASSADYTVLTPSPLTIAPGSGTATIMIRIEGDTAIEGTEDLNLQLLTPTNATLGLPQQHTVRIVNDDCLGTGTFTICPDAPLADAVTLTPDLITDTSPLCTASSTTWTQAGQPTSCIVFARSITVDTTRAWGSKPLVLVATETIAITSLLDASAHGGYWGPASNPAVCNPPAFPGPYSGGAGGSFMTTGGNGGSHTNPTGAASLAGAPVSTPPLLLRGGCPGVVGGDNFSSSTYGSGGGAVYLVAGTSITLAAGAIINASGAGATAGLDISNGGSGGGSGGMIVLHAAAIAASGAFIVANGGGGAEGGDTNKYGSDGGVPNPTTPFVAAPGGAGNGGGNGGAGFAEGFAATSGASATNTSGAGGGGGGAGYIKTNQPLTGASVSPAPL